MFDRFRAYDKIQGFREKGMGNDLLLRRKLTLRSGDRKLVLQKKPVERTEHVLMKAFLWVLYLPEYKDLIVEYNIGDRYKPDVISLDAHGEPLFWGEAGKVNREKIESLVRRYPRTHIVIAKWSVRLQPYVEIVEAILKKYPRKAPFDLLNFPADGAERFIEPNGEIRISREEIEWVRMDDNMTDHFIH